MITLPWTEKYRPKTLDNILYHTEIIKLLKIFIQNESLPHLLFYGPPGTGKTSTILACAKELYTNIMPTMVMELNASDDRGIDVVRHRIKQFVASENILKTKKNIFKLVILDEVDHMTSDAQAILRKIIEKYAYNARFCLICNYIQYISPALQSRCTNLKFQPVDDKNINAKIREISEKENIQLQKEAINAIIEKSNGDMRKAINILQSISMTSINCVSENDIYKLLDYPNKNDIASIFQILINDTIFEAYEKIVNIIVSNNYLLIDIINEIHSLLIHHIKVTNDSLKPEKICKILDKMRNIEINIANNANDKIQLASFISVFHL